jgi:hypothetical protein
MFALYRGGFLRATSVGFLPKEWREVTDPKRRGMMPLDFVRQELLEYSLVPVPSNPRALLDAAKAGLDVGLAKEWAEMTADTQTGEAKAQAEALALSASSVVMVDMAVHQAVCDELAQAKAKLAEIAGQYLRKGAKVYIEGSLRTRKWQDKATGADRYTTEIVASEMQMLDRAGDRGGDDGAGQPSETAGGSTDDFDDSDIPF